MEAERLLFYLCVTTGRVNMYQLEQVAYHNQEPDPEYLKHLLVVLEDLGIQIDERDCLLDQPESNEFLVGDEQDVWNDDFDDPLVGEAIKCLKDLEYESDEPLWYYYKDLAVNPILSHEDELGRANELKTVSKQS